MTGLTQQEQEQNSPFTLEAVLEEESDINTNHINDALPFDKCLKADTQADEKETIWLWNPLQNDLNNILSGTSLAIGIFVVVAIANTRYNFIPTKMNETDYMIKEDVVDCPIAVKNKFLYYVNIDELYGKVNAEKNRFEWLNNDGECCHYWTFEKSKDKNDFEYQIKYLADQLEAGKVYRLADIITDKVKKKAGE